MSFYTPPAATEPSAGATVTPTTSPSATRGTTTSSTTHNTSTVPAQFFGVAAQFQTTEGVWTLSAAWIFVGLMNMLMDWILV